MVLAEQKHRLSAWMLGAICAVLCMPEANAQLAFEPVRIQANPGDSLDLMTQMWHALPEAEVGGIALAGGASDASEVPGPCNAFSKRFARCLTPTPFARFTRWRA